MCSPLAKGKISDRLDCTAPTSSYLVHRSSCAINGIPEIPDQGQEKRAKSRIVLVAATPTSSFVVHRSSHRNKQCAEIPRSRTKCKILRRSLCWESDLLLRRPSNTRQRAPHQDPKNKGQDFGLFSCLASDLLLRRPSEHTRQQQHTKVPGQEQNLEPLLMRGIRPPRTSSIGAYPATNGASRSQSVGPNGNYLGYSLA